VTVLAAGLLLGAHLVHDHLGTAAMLHHLQFHGGALHVRLAHVGGLAVVHQEHVLQGEGALDLSVDAVEVVVAIGLNPHLGAGGLNDGVGTGAGSRAHGVKGVDRLT